MTGWGWQSIFFRGSLFNWPHVDTAGYATVGALIFPRAPELCGSLLCQGFLAKILICLPSRLQSGFSFVWPAPCGCRGKASWGIISIAGYSQPFLVIQYQNNTLYSCTPPCSSNQHCWCDYYYTSQSQFSLPVSVLSPVYIFTIFYFLFFTLVSYGERRHPKHSKHPLTYKHADEMTVSVR